jgi:hypothetical protein
MIAIPMGTHYTTLMTDLFLHVYEPDFSSLNRNRNVAQSNQLHSLLYRLCSVITRNIEINKRGKSTKNFTTSFFKNITAVGPLYSASHYVESELEDFPPLFSICGQ